MVEMKDTVEKPTKDSESTDIVKPMSTKNDAKSDTSDVEEINMTNGTMNPADDPKLKKLIELDTKYMSLENEYAVEWAALQKKYEEKQKPLLNERTEIVKKGDISSFWLQVLEGHPIFNDEIQEWDKPVLELCTNIRAENLPDESGKNQKGFKIIFEFDHAEGSEEYDALPFTNKSLTRVYETGLESEYLTEVTVKKIKMEEEIQWKIGKDITIEMKKVKEEGNKKKGKAKAAAKEKVQKVERASIFRLFFRTISMEEPDTLKDLLDRSLMEMGFDAQDIDDEEELEQAYEDALEKVSDDAYEMGLALRDNIIPFAIRWYTGEACPMDDDEEDYDEDHDDDEDDDEDDDGDDSDEGDDHDDDSDEEGGKKKKDKDDGNPFKTGSDKSGLFKSKDGKEGDKKEECKQQ